jgi:hypothetical protein
VSGVSSGSVLLGGVSAAGSWEAVGACSSNMQVRESESNCPVCSCTFLVIDEGTLGYNAWDQHIMRQQYVDCLIRGSSIYAASAVWPQFSEALLCRMEAAT